MADETSKRRNLLIGKWIPQDRQAVMRWAKRKLEDYKVCNHNHFFSWLVPPFQENANPPIFAYSWRSLIRRSTIRYAPVFDQIWNPRQQETLINDALLFDKLPYSVKIRSPLKIELESVNCTFQGNLVPRATSTTLILLIDVVSAIRIIKKWTKGLGANLFLRLCFIWLPLK